MTTGVEFLDVYLAALEHQRGCGRGLLPSWPAGALKPWFVCVGCVIKQDTDRLWDDGDVRRDYSCAVPNREALEVIAAHSPGGVVEIGAGSGYWAWELQRMGVDVIAYDPHPFGSPELASPDWQGYHWTKAWAQVHRGNHQMVTQHPDRTLLMCWPEFASLWSELAVELYQGDTIIYVGEGPGGCTGNDRFHKLLGVPPSCWHVDDDYNQVPCPPGCASRTTALFEETTTVDIPQWASMHDRLSVHQRVVRKVLSTRPDREVEAAR